LLNRPIGFTHLYLHNYREADRMNTKLTVAVLGTGIMGARNPVAATAPAAYREPPAV
jgi:hypothetical protein